MSLQTSTAIRLFQRKDPISQVSETDRLFSIFTFSYPLEDLTFETCWETFRDGFTCSTYPHEILNADWSRVN